MITLTMCMFTLSSGMGPGAMDIFSFSRTSIFAQH